MKKGPQNEAKIDAQIIKNLFWAAKGATRTHWDCFLGGGGDGGGDGQEKGMKRVKL